MNEVQKRFKRDLPELDPETDMSVTDSEYRKSQRKSETLEGLLQKHPLAKSATLEEWLTLLRHKQVIAPDPKHCSQWGQYAAVAHAALPSAVCCCETVLDLDA